MNCHDARELFSALIDETLTREERADVYGHLATCAECRRELAAIERTVALVRGATPVRAPVGFVDRVVAAARPTPWYARAARAVLLPWPVKLPLGAAAVVLVAGLAVLMFRGSQPQVSQDRMAPAPSAPVATPAAPPPTAPAETSATAPPVGASSNRAASAPEQDRPAAATSRVDDATKPAEAEKRDATRDEKLSDTRAPAPTMQSAPSAAGETALAKREFGARAAGGADVIARLAAPDRDTAERALAALTARLSGEVTARRVEGDTTVVELVIPRDRYGDFTREAARLGVFRIESESPAPPDSLRIAVRLGS